MMRVMILNDGDNISIQIELGRRLQQLRLQLNMSQIQLAEAAGVSRRTVTNTENGNGCSLLTLISLLKAMGVSARWDLLLPSGDHPLNHFAPAANMPKRRRASGERGQLKSHSDPWNWE